ncbi:hypothetical protein HYT02_01140 [Candidatus Gottesmanbacteria bacterium]|nr:hypothetical protein [Candidatus Gottesmanbacteria bacterium]
MKTAFKTLAISAGYLVTTSPVFAANGAGAATNTPTPIVFTKPEGSLGDFSKLFSGAVQWLLLIGFILAFFYLILGGISWVTSGGDKTNIEAARNKIIAAIIGLVIVASTWALFSLIGGAIGFNILGTEGFSPPILY